MKADCRNAVIDLDCWHYSLLESGGLGGCRSCAFLKLSFREKHAQDLDIRRVVGRILPESLCGTVDRSDQFHDTSKCGLTESDDLAVVAMRPFHHLCRAGACFHHLHRIF